MNSRMEVKMERKRSLGVTLFGILYIFSGLSSLFSTFSRFSYSKIIFDVVFLTVGINILRLKEWARIAVIWLNVIAFFSAVLLLCFQILMFHGDKVHGSVFWPIYKIFVYGLISIGLIILLTILFFRQPKVKEQFE